MIYSCTCPSGSCYVDGKCHFQEDCIYKARTNADVIRSMSDIELYDFLDKFAHDGPWYKEFEEAFCSDCKPVQVERNLFGREIEYYECEFEDGHCPYYDGDCLKWWLGKEAY